MKSLEPKSIDCVITDPPYGTTACAWDSVIPFEPMWEQLKRITKMNAAIVLFGSQPFTSALVMSNVKMFKYEWVYNKTKGVGYLNSNKMPITNHENILIFSKGKTIYNPQFTKGKPYKKIHRNEKSGSCYAKSTRKNGDVFVNNGTRYPTTSILPISNPSGKGQLHPTQKPIALMEYLIKTYTNEGDNVLDFTMGSGTTGVAAMQLGRNFIGCEIDPEYFAISERRIKAAQAQDRLDLTQSYEKQEVIQEKLLL